jgi:small GTP-binding protein
MGKVLSKLMKRLSADGPKRILMLGLDNAGKTTILYRMKRTEDFHTVPTIGFNVETISPSPGISLTVWDVGGQDHLRTLWHHYFDNVDGLVFVIDSTDVRRLHVARAELEGIYQHDSMKYVPLIVLANKQDSEDALTGEQIAGKLDLLAWPEGSYYIIPCCAINGDGITDAFTILAQMIRTQKKTHRLKFS